MTGPTESGAGGGEGGAGAGKIRSFIAVHLPPAVRAALARTAGELGAGMRFVKWVEEENIHLTLAFLGEIERERVDAVARALADLAPAARPFALHVRGLGAFPSPRRPRVLWAGLAEGAEELRALAAEVQAALEPLGFPRERRPFSAHVTLGRVREGSFVPPLLVQRLETLTFDSEPFEIGEVHLMRSTLTRQGPIYASQAAVRLGGG